MGLFRACSFLVLAAGIGMASTPAPPILEFEGMPSFQQRDAAFLAGGRAYCAPTAASNALMWLAGHGYPGLRPGGQDAPGSQKDMIERLAALMGTYRDGTPLESFRCGINAYLRAAGYPERTWTSTGQPFREPPEVRKLGALPGRGTVAWLGLGCYERRADSSELQRHSGHLVTLAGCRFDPGDGTLPELLLLSDPERPEVHRRMRLVPLEAGKLSGTASGCLAKGYFRLQDEQALQTGTEDRILVLETIQALTLR